ncbi:hypothetical protein GPECTOR_94g637 [Gonium pectorale]|uniref:Lipase n=1 Tax=Gonium pectorale TaxID=33097 RepID=A0A150G1F7_GONPE|nr:hypothetical protein GPECTOR_94g637 [Gonium pectorale]|eukprot:KXZ43315.1 hypothetical protein GPECTOR_94g637 [Gonium pectorale]
MRLVCLAIACVLTPIVSAVREPAWGRSKLGTVANEDPLAKVASLVTPYNYPLQVHNVQTSDGFILTLLRIPHGIEGTRGAAGALHNGSRPVAFLQHGLLDSAAGFLVNGPGESLAFILADEGYDVWLGNMRGNSLSRGHASLDPSDARFWQWSYDEMAAYDMPTMGTTVLLAALAGAGGSSGAGKRSGSGPPPGPALRADEIERAVLMAPVAVAKHISSIPLLAMAAMNTDDMFSLMGLHEFLPSQELIAALEGRLCVAQPYLCVSFLTSIAGYNPDNLDNARLPIYLRFTPAGTSVQNMAHWAQVAAGVWGFVRRNVRARAPNTMSFFDYGTDCASWTGRCNQLQYGRMTPPLYNLTAIRTPLAVISGSQDTLAAPLDVEYLLESLGPGVAKLVKNLDSYDHLDFIWGINAKDLLYSDVLRFLATGQGPDVQA